MTLPSRGYLLAASILAADFSRLGAQISESQAAGVDWIHIDVMDGQFVPGLSVGPPVIRAIRAITTLPLDVHLMVHEPSRFLDSIQKAGADWITVHVEACTHLHRVIQQIHDLGCKAGIGLNPSTPLFTLEEVLPELDMALIACVDPGLGGQKLIPASLRKISRLRQILDTMGSMAKLEVDGGVNEATCSLVVEAGASVLVMGSAVFCEGNIVDNVLRLPRRNAQ